MKLNKILVNSIVATVLSLNLQAKVTMPAIFTDGMVLQQESKVPIWGSTDKKSKPVCYHFVGQQKIHCSSRCAR